MLHCGGSGDFAHSQIDTCIRCTRNAKEGQRAQQYCNEKPFHRCLARGFSIGSYSKNSGSLHLDLGTVLWMRR